MGNNTLASVAESEMAILEIFSFGYDRTKIFTESYINEDPEYYRAGLLIDVLSWNYMS